MITVSEARERGAALLGRRMGLWATEAAEEPVFNLWLRPPAETRMQKEPKKVDEWVRGWQQFPTPPDVQWVERRWRTFGTQVLPERAVIDSPDSLAHFVGGAPAKNWRLLKKRVGSLMALLGEGEDVRKTIRSRAKRILNLDDTNFTALLGVLEWLGENSIEGLRPRQLPIRGVDSKWFGTHRDLVQKLHHASTGADLGVVGAKKLIRLRILDAQLSVGGLTDFACTKEELAALAIRPRTVFIFENLESVLAMPSWPGAVVIHGSGYAVSTIGEVPWLGESNTIYWGDLDSDGFAILNVLRSHLGGVPSVLMDEQTFLAHADLWVEDPSPSRRELPTLSEGEQRTLERLQEEGDVRLEQERIPWEAALQALRQASNVGSRSP